jgi:hypothetical protein
MACKFQCTHALCVRPVTLTIRWNSRKDLVRDRLLRLELGQQKLKKK